MNLSLSNLFQTNPSTDFIYSEFAFAIIIILFFSSFIISYLRKNKLPDSWKKACSSLPSAFRWLSVVIFIMTWARIAGVSYLSMRVWWIVILIVFIIIIYFTYQKKVKYEKNKKKFSKKNDKTIIKNKYLPKKKK